MTRPLSAGSKIIVRPEEALIVILVLMLWMAAIGLFFHRWGKIRMLEPYTPKFEEDIRPMCPLPSMDPIVANKRMSLCPLTSIQCGPSWNPNAIGVGRGERNAILCKLYPRGSIQLTSSPQCIHLTLGLGWIPSSWGRISSHRPSLREKPSRPSTYTRCSSKPSARFSVKLRDVFASQITHSGDFLRVTSSRFS